MVQKNISTKRESPEKTADLLFGFTTISDMLQKAKRDFDRYITCDIAQDRTDHALNCIVTLAHLADWHSKLDPASGNRDQLRNECYELKIVTDICNAFKHRALDYNRLSGVEESQVKIINGAYISFSPNLNVQNLSAHAGTTPLKTIRTVVDDDQIEAFEVIGRDHTVQSDQKVIPLTAVLRSVLEFWKRKLQANDSSRRPRNSSTSG